MFKQPNFNKVLVLDTNRKPLMPCFPARARKLLEKGRASVFKKYPFTIILHDRTVEESVLQDIEIKIDQGSKTTGVALVVHGNTEDTVAFAAHLDHRANIKSLLDSRRIIRRSRRNRKTRYRAPRFLNRTKPKGWLPPSVKSKADNILTWVNRFRKLVPISGSALETAKFDTQKLENPELCSYNHPDWFEIIDKVGVDVCKAKGYQKAKVKAIYQAMLKAGDADLIQRIHRAFFIGDIYSSKDIKEKLISLGAPNPTGSAISRWFEVKKTIKNGVSAYRILHRRDTFN